MPLQYNTLYLAINRPYHTSSDSLKQFLPIPLNNQYSSSNRRQSSPHHHPPANSNHRQKHIQDDHHNYPQIPHLKLRRRLQGLHNHNLSPPSLTQRSPTARPLLRLRRLRHRHAPGRLPQPARRPSHHGVQLHRNRRANRHQEHQIHPRKPRRLPLHLRRPVRAR